MANQKDSFWSTPLTSSLVRSQDVKLSEMLFGYFIVSFEETAKMVWVAIAYAVCAALMLLWTVEKTSPRSRRPSRSKKSNLMKHSPQGPVNQ